MKHHRIANYTLYSTLIIMSCPVSAQFFRSSTLLPKSRLSLIWDFARPCWRLWWKGNWHRIDTHTYTYIMPTWTSWMQQKYSKYIQTDVSLVPRLSASLLQYTHIFSMFTSWIAWISCEFTTISLRGSMPAAASMRRSAFSSGKAADGTWGATA